MAQPPQASPVKPIAKAAARHSRAEIQDLVVPNNSGIVSVDAFLEILGDATYNPNITAPPLFGTVSVKDLTKKFIIYANSVSNAIREKLGTDGMFNLGIQYECAQANSDRIVWHYHGDNIPSHQISGNKCKPDVVAVWEKNYVSGTQLRWPYIESANEVQSTGTSFKDGVRQESSYQLVHLETRPDRHNVQGLYVHQNGLVFFSASPGGLSVTHLVKWSDPNCFKLFAALNESLYRPHKSMFNPLIERVLTSSPSHCTWNITFSSVPSKQHSGSAILPPVVAKGYKLLYSNSPLGRRTHVLVNNDPHTIFNERRAPVIKIQYIRMTRRFNEPEIIRHIHKQRPFPGVVQIVHEELLQASGERCIIDGREVTLIALEQFGKPFMAVKTVRAGLTAIYDLLESTFNRSTWLQSSNTPC